MALVNLPAGTGEMRAKSAPNISPRAAVVVATAAVAVGGGVRSRASPRVDAVASPRPSRAGTSGRGANISSRVGTINVRHKSASNVTNRSFCSCAGHLFHSSIFGHSARAFTTG